MSDTDEYDPFAEPDAEEESLDAPALAAHARVLPEQRIYGTPEGQDADLDATPWWRDAAALIMPGAAPAETLGAPTLDDLGASLSRTARRAARVTRQTAAEPMDAVTGLLSGATLGGADELAGLTSAHPILSAVPGGAILAGLSEAAAPTEGYTRARDEARERQHTAEARSPSAYGTADTVGAALSALAAPEVRAGEGMGVLGTALLRAGEGAAVTGTAAGLSSEAEGVDRLSDAAPAAAGGFLLGGGASLLGSAVSRGGAAVSQRAPVLAQEADRARIASVLGERRAPITDAEMQTLTQTLGGRGRDRVHRAAQRIRESGIVGPFSSVQEIADRAEAARERATRPLSEIRAQFEETGGRVPVSRVPDALRSYASRELDTGETTAPLAGATRELADQWENVGMAHGRIDRIPEAPTRSLAELERALRQHDRSVPWVTSTGAQARLPAEVAQGERRVIRDTLDDVVAEHPPMAPTVRDDFRAARREYQTAQTIGDVAGRRALRGQMRTDPIAEAARIGTTAIAGGGAAVPAMVAGLGTRLLRGRTGTGYATGVEAVQRMVEGGLPQSMQRWGSALQSAAQRGPEALAATHYVLSQTDPEYRATLASEESSPDDAAPPQDVFDPFAEEEAQP